MNNIQIPVRNEQHDGSRLVWGAALCGAVYLAVLPMAGTIALRNIALLGILLILVVHLRSLCLDRWVSIAIVAWALYLLLFPWISSDFSEAMKNLGGQWGRSLLALFAGAGLAVILHRSRWGSIFALGVVSAIPILVHLAMFAWKGLETGTIPWGYWGRERHHADLGYAAGHVAILMSVVVLRGEPRHRLSALLLILAALLSTVFARSRAGFAFAVLGGLMVFSLICLMQSKQKRGKILGVLSALLLLAGVIFLLAAKNDRRWDSLIDRMEAGFLGDSLLIACDGTDSIEPLIRAAHQSPDFSNQLINGVRNGDGARMVVLRAGVRLSMESPWGSDGSRMAFRKLLQKKCESPKLITVHAHNAWIDTALAIGWGGALLYLAVLVMFLRFGIAQSQKQSPSREWAVVLIATSLFWIVRGLTDSVFRDHMLEMQGLLLAFAAVSAKILSLREGHQTDVPDA